MWTFGLILLLFAQFILQIPCKKWATNGFFYDSYMNTVLKNLFLPHNFYDHHKWKRRDMASFFLWSLRILYKLTNSTSSEYSTLWLSIETQYTSTVNKLTQLRSVNREIPLYIVMKKSRLKNYELKSSSLCFRCVTNILIPQLYKMK